MNSTPLQPVSSSYGVGGLGDLSSASQGLNFLQNHLKSQLLDRVRTGDLLYDTIIACVILSGQDSLVKILGWLKNKIFNSPDRMYQFIMRIYAWYKKRKDNTIIKETKVSYITDDREINTLFAPIMWYITSLTDTKEYNSTVLETTAENKLVMQKVPFNNSSSFKFKGYTIDYTITTQKIEIYGDRKYERENTIITLKVKVDRYRKQDIFKEFSEESIEKYAEYNKNQKWEQRIYRNEKSGGSSSRCDWKDQKKKTYRKIDTVVLKNGDMKDIVDDIDEFLSKKQWYVDRGIPWTRRFMFYGKPGTGKSSAITAIACHTNRHVHYLILSEIESDTELFRLLESINFEETILVIEDIDCASSIVRKREAQKALKEELTGENKEEKPPVKEKEEKKSKLTLSGFLNAIDGGIIETHGQIMIITTNHPEDLDDAVTRSGRVDIKVEFGNCNDSQIRGIYESFFQSGPPDTPPSPPDTPATYKFTPGYISPADVSSTLLRYSKDPVEAWNKLIEKFKFCNSKNIHDIYEEVFRKAPPTEHTFTTEGVEPLYVYNTCLQYLSESRPDYAWEYLVKTIV